MPIIFKETKINLNITSKAIRYGLPLRIFDILCCGGFVISNYQPEIPELFTPGEDLVMYGSQEELGELIAYYLEHDGERREIAHNGLETLKANYTYEKQIAKIFEMAFFADK
jgi:spore maturation protein CgeB